MIDPQYQWCAPIDVTNVCNRSCSNCTRIVGHSPTFFMDTKQFCNALKAVKDFPENSPPSKSASFKLVGIIGGEPLFHPKFPELLEIMRTEIPNKDHRGLWTGLHWQATKHVGIIEKTFHVKYIHNNRHDLQRSRHSPILVAIKDVIDDPIEQTTLIDNCWLQNNWCSTITPKGYFFCEVAGAFDWVFNGPGGLPVEPDCWKRPISDFQEQIDQWCPMCGIPLQLKGRIDSEEIDDISQSNLELLKDSSRVQAHDYIIYAGQNKTTARPWEYRE